LNPTKAARQAMKQKQSKLPSFPVSVTTLPSSGFNLDLEAAPDERMAIAEDSGVLSVESLHADLVFRRWRRDGVAVTGSLRAGITQACVVTLDPLQASIEAVIDRTFLPEGSNLTKPRLNNEGEMILDPDGRDEPDVFAGDRIDAWEIVLEQFNLEIDPFPRTPGLDPAVLGDEEDAGDAGHNSPFSGLKDMIKAKNTD